jgi:Tol biopolymer transport system component
MRATFAFALVGVLSVVTPEESRRYLVIPVGHVVDSGAHPCRPSLSADGGVVAFDASVALDPSDQNGRADVYLLDRATTHVTLVSRNPSGVAARGTSRCPSLSGDGQRVVFESDASDLIDDDQPGTSDVFLLDRRTGVLRRLSAFPGAGPTTSANAAISSDGRVVVFHSRRMDAPASVPTRVYRIVADHDGIPEDIGEGHSPAVSGDGRVLAYVTTPRPGEARVIRVVGPEGTRTVGQPDGQDSDAEAFAPALSVDGRWIAYVVRTRSPVAPQEGEARTQVYLERIGGGERHLVSSSAKGREGNGHSGLPSIDGTGSRVVFESAATTLGCGGRGRAGCDRDLNLLADIFVWDRNTLQVTRVNTVTPELPWLEGGTHAAISLDGGTIAFLSRQPVSGADGRDTFDLFITHR